MTKVSWHVACKAEKWTHTWAWWGKLEGERKGQIWRPRQSWENNFRLDFKETGWYSMKWIRQTHGSNKQWCMSVLWESNLLCSSLLSPSSPFFKYFTSSSLSFYSPSSPIHTILQSGPKKCIHSLLINIFGINLNEISISGWECNIMFLQQMAQAFL